MIFSDLKINQFISETIEISTELIDRFAQITGDFNPIHLDDSAAIKAGFERRIAHGLICQAEVSRLLGTKLPGEGSILLQENFSFLLPVYAGNIITTTITVKELNSEKYKVKLGFQCVNQQSQTVLVGDALVKFKK